jgi:hypothetical protein
MSFPNEGWLRSELAMKLPRWLHETKHEVTFESSNLKPIEHNRNVIVKRFLDGDYDYLLQVDSDVVPSKNPIDLADLELDVVSAPCWIYQKEVFLNAYRLDENSKLKPISSSGEKGLIEVDAIGSGVLMTSRAVLGALKAPFERKYDENGIASLGQDLYFSEKARNAGFRIFTHLDYVSKHYKTINLGDFS